MASADLCMEIQKYQAGHHQDAALTRIREEAAQLKDPVMEEWVSELTLLHQGNRDSKDRGVRATADRQIGFPARGALFPPFAGTPLPIRSCLIKQEQRHGHCVHSSPIFPEIQFLQNNLTPILSALPEHAP